MEHGAGSSTRSLLALSARASLFRVQGLGSLSKPQKVGTWFKDD